jgi:hypothetical protein
MTELYKACRDVTWVHEGVISQNDSDEKVCAYGTTPDKALEAADEMVDEQCPWWFMFGNMICRRKGSEVSAETVDVDYKRWFGSFLKLFS